MSIRISMLAALLALSCTKGTSSKSIDSGLFCDSLPDVGGDGGKRNVVEVKRKVREHLDQFEACFRRALERDPKARGRVEVRFVIGAEGSVSSACIHKTTLEDSEAVECMLDEFRALKFGPSTGKSVVIYPLSYSSS